MQRSKARDRRGEREGEKRVAALPDTRASPSHASSTARTIASKPWTGSANSEALDDREPRAKQTPDR